MRHDQAMSTPTAEHVVDALIAGRLLEPDARPDSIRVVAGVLGTGSQPADGAGGRALPRVVEVVAYVGGALVLAAGGLFLVQQWDDLGFAARVVMLAVVAGVLALAGTVASWVPGATSVRETAYDSRRRLAGTLLTGAALVLAFLGGYVVDHELGTPYPDVYWPAVLGAAAGVLVAAAAYRVAPTAVGLVGLLGGLITVATNAIAGVDSHEGPVIGGVLFLTGVVWLGLAEAGVFREVDVARALGVSTAFVGAQVPVIEGSDSWLGYVLTLALAVAGIAVYVGKVAWPYLAAAVISVTVVVPEAVVDWTDDSLGAIGAVLVAGMTLLLASLAGYRLRAGAID
jgi:hypothetical protein